MKYVLSDEGNTLKLTKRYLIYIRSITWSHMRQTI